MRTGFANRSDQLFGREVDIQRLCDLAMRKGLTAIVARPLMGKTWTLTEMARRLSEEGDYLIGYHESKGAESSHLLYAVSDLYSRWLANSTMREQAISLWSRHKNGLVPRIGKMIGSLFDELATKPLEGVGAIVSNAFDGLAEAQNDLLGGGLQIAPLPYDQALSLATLVANISGRRTILILDAWEKSTSLRSEYTTLDAYLSHLDDWPPSHIFLAIRNPEVDSTQVNREAFERAGDLSQLSPAAQLYELGPIDTADETEQKRIATFLRSKVNAAKDVAERDLMQWIDGYPGVLNFWTSEARRTHMQSTQDLRDEAVNAQSLRYIEFDHSLKNLKGDHRTLAARLAFFPRLDPNRWALFERLFKRDIAPTAFDELVDTGILIDDPVPTFGHDTRHVAAQHWFVKHSKPLIRRTGEELVEMLAAGITGINHESVPMFEVLVACTDAAKQVQMQGPQQCLIDAAHAAYDRTENICNPHFDQNYPQAMKRNGSFAVLISVALLLRGLAKGQRGDVDGELADYTTAIELPGALPEQIAIALFNRGIARGQRGDVDGELADYTTAIELPGAPPEQVATALFNRGNSKGQRGEFDSQLADYTTVIDLPGAPPEQIATALIIRGGSKGQRGDVDGQLADYATAIELPRAPQEQVATALIMRGGAKGRRGDVDGQLADYATAIELPGAPPEQIAMALIIRGFTKGQRSDVDGALADYTTAIELPGAPPKQVAMALYNRGMTKGQRGDVDDGLADLTAAIKLPGAPPELVAKAIEVSDIIMKQRAALERG